MSVTEAVALGGVTPTASSFLLEVDGVPIGAFRALSGLELTVSVEEYEEGGVNGFTHRFPGRMTWPNLVFSRGLTDSDALFAWVRRSAGEGFEAAGGKLTRNTVAVTVVSHDGKRLRAYEIEGAFPVRWTGPRLASGDPEALTEELEVTHTGFRSSGGR